MLPTSFADGRYEVKSFLGEGSRKKVYRAHDDRLDRDVAFAVIKTEGLDEAGLTRVRREAQAMGRLGDHPHIVTIHDIGDESGQPYIVSQLMPGGDLAEMLQKAEGHRLEVDATLRIASEMAQALGYAHSQGIIHRDLKPANIWLTEEGTAKLGDFGLAVALDRSRMTTEGTMVGTVAYMPPEQALGRQADARSDLYSLGCVLYEMLTGRPPFLGDDAVAVISQHINTAPVAPSWHNPEVPTSLEGLVLALLAKTPEERPDSAATVGDALRSIQESSSDERVVAQPPAAVAGLQGVSWGQFVGRQDEMDKLKTALENALSGSGSLVMLVGEPGIGKTRLAEQFAVYAGLRGAQVLVGRCHEGEAPVPYLPFVDVLRQYVRDRPDDALRQELGEAAPEVAQLVSEVRQRFPDIPESLSLEDGAERLRLFESVSAFLHNAAAANPLVIILDDLHWADKPSLLLLRHLARRISGERILVLGAYRDVELDRTHPLAEVIATLRQETGYQRILIRGLQEEDVLALLAAADPSEESAQGRQALAVALHQETEGNPFFLREVLNHLVEEGKLYREGNRWISEVASISELGIPEGVREVVGRRLSRLSEGCNRMLTLASTMTGGFAWETLKAISEEEESSLLDLLDEALAARLIEERKGEQAGTYDFTHALIRQTLYGELSTPRRVVLHRQIGGALEQVYADNPEPHLSELAHHFYQAAPGGDVDKAIDYAQRAGDRALILFAYEDAVGHYETALQALDLKGKPDEALRCELLLALGDSQRRAGDADKARDKLQQAADIAKKLGASAQLARCALGFPLGFGGVVPAGVIDETLIGLLEEALAALEQKDSPLRARVLGRLSVELYFSGSHERRAELSQQAMEMARRVDDPVALVYALRGRYYALWGPENVEERLAVATEVVQLGEQAGDTEMVLTGRSWRLNGLLELGDRPAADAEMEAFARLAEELRQPLYLWSSEVHRTLRALLDGRFEEAERLAQQALAIGQVVQDPNVAQSFGAQMGTLRREQGRVREVEAAVKGFVTQYPAVPAWRAGLAFVYSEVGREEEARSEFEHLAANDFADLPRDALWITAVAYLSEVCAFLGDSDRAATLYDLLGSHANRCIVIGLVAVACYGSASRNLGLLAATMSRWEEAEQHFENALEMNTRIGASPWLARTQQDYAKMRLSRAEPGDREKALELLALALDAAQQLGMKRLTEEALALKLRAQGIDTSDVRTSVAAVAASVYLDKPDLRPHAAPDGTVTIMFSDIEGSTAKTEELGDQRWMEVLREHNAIVREQLAAHEGFEVKSEGDGFMLAFQSARKALQCAIETQKAFAKRAETSDVPLSVRMGLHTGEMIKEGDDFFGKHVNLAARIAGQATGGEILVSSLLRELTASGGDIEFGEPRSVELKGLTGDQEMYPVSWRNA